MKLLAPFCQNPEGEFLENLGEMSEQSFDALLTGYKYRAAQAKAEVEKQKADAQELERLRKVEADRLAQEAEEKKAAKQFKKSPDKDKVLAYAVQVRDLADALLPEDLVSIHKEVNKFVKFLEIEAEKL